MVVVSRSPNCSVPVSTTTPFTDKVQVVSAVMAEPPLLTLNSVSEPTHFPLTEMLDLSHDLGVSEGVAVTVTRVAVG